MGWRKDFQNAYLGNLERKSKKPEKPQKTFRVTVEKTKYFTGSVEVEASSPEEAIKKVNQAIRNGLQTSSVSWDDGEYLDDSFQTTGDVDEA